MNTPKQKSWFKDCLRMFDYFGVNFTFKINEKSKYQSSFGGFVFIIFLFQLIFYFLLTFIEFWKRENYSIIYSISTTNPAPEINFYKSGFNFAYSLQFDNDTFVGKNVLDSIEQKIMLTKVNDSDNNTKNKTELQTKLCELSDFYKSIDLKTFNSLNLQKFTCAKLDNSTSIIGTFADPIYQYIELSILLKDEVFNHDQNKQVNLEYLSNLFSKNPIKLVLYWIDTSVNVRDYKNPVSQYFRSHISYLDFSTILKTNIDFSVLNFSSDSNILFNLPDFKNYITFMETQEFSLSCSDRYILGSLGKTLSKFFLRSSTKNILLDRSYMKITQFLANIGGLQTNILLGLFVFVSFLNDFWAEQKVMNKILKFREYFKVTHPDHYKLLKNNLRSINVLKTSDNNPKIKYDLPLNNELNNVKSNENITSKEEANDFNKDNINNHNKTPINSNLEDKQEQISFHHLDLKKRVTFPLEIEEENILVNSNKPVNFNCIEIILRYCPCKYKTLVFKNIYYEKASKKMEYYFDILTYSKKIQEIDLLKYLLLDKNQIKLFNFLSKPSISKAYIDSDEIYQTQQRNRVGKSKLDIEEIEEIIKSYYCLKENDDKLNNKLFYLFDYEVDHLLIG